MYWFLLQSSDSPDIEFNYDDADDHEMEIAGKCTDQMSTIAFWSLQFVRMLQIHPL